MFEYIKNIINNNTPQGKLDLTIFSVNSFLLLNHLVLFVIYLFSKNWFIITADAVSIAMYIYFIFNCIRKKNLFIIMVYTQIVAHMVIGATTFGLVCGYQNYAYALLCACVIPNFSPLSGSRKMDKRPVLFSIVCIAIYFAIVACLHDYVPEVRSALFNNVLYSYNSLISFIAIMIFTLFYTSKTIRKEHELSRRADYDELTSLYNRHALNHIGNNIINQAKMAKQDFSAAIIDIDFFKKINDTYGHTIGDEVLRELSNIIRSYSVRGVVPGRWGGEEFVMIAPYTVDYNEFCVILEKLREKVENTKIRVSAKKTINITISIGASVARNIESLDEVVSQADKRLYQAKESGRNKLVS